MSALVENRESDKESFRIGNISSMDEMIEKGNEPSVKQKFIAECLGTLLLVFIATGSGVYTNFEINAATISGGLIVTALVYIFQKISGAHFNPAVSLAMLLIKKITIKEFYKRILLLFWSSIFG